MKKSIDLFEVEFDSVNNRKLKQDCISSFRGPDRNFDTKDSSQQSLAKAGAMLSQGRVVMNDTWW